jgi:hypothetical protein
MFGPQRIAGIVIAGVMIGGGGVALAARLAEADLVTRLGAALVS